MLTLLFSVLSGKASVISLVIQICVLLFIVVCCTPVHESAHAWMAARLGDQTGRLHGRISLNPLVHMDWIGALMIVLFGFGYAKPVPVNIRNFPPKKRKLYFALTALAGPVSNLLMALIFALLCGGALFLFVKTNPGLSIAAAMERLYDLTDPNVLKIAFYFFYFAVRINCMLAVFNLIPVPPLDGSRLITAVLPDKWYYKLLALERYSMWIIFGALFLFNRLGFSPIGIVAEWVANLIIKLGALPFALFL